MKVAVIQFQAGKNKAANVHKALGLVRRAIRNKAKFILLPEVFVYRGKIKNIEQLSLNSESVHGSTIQQLFALGRQHRVFILAGSIYEPAKGARKFYNTSILINDQGKASSIYRKINLFEARLGRKKITESKNLLAGRKLSTARVGSFKVGLTICYDLRFPELYRRYVQEGVQVLCVPSAFTRETGRAHWKTLVRSRAIENLCYVLAPNQVGKDDRGMETYGHSLIVGPWGEVLAEGSLKKEEILYADINMDRIRKARKKLPGVLVGKF